MTSRCSLPKLEFGSPRVRSYNEKQYEDGRLEDLDRLEEVRDITTIQSAKYLQGSRRYHDGNVRGRAFSNGDLVLKKVHKSKSKLSPIWEDPYIVSEMTRPRAYRLKHEDQLSRLFT